MAKYGKDIINKICSLITEDSYTIAEICKNVGITETTFYEWKANKVEFSDAIKKADDERLESFVTEATKSLRKKIQGYTVEETCTVYVDKGKDGEKPSPRVKEKIVTTKYFPPDTAAIIFTLTNRDPDRWKNKQFVEATGKDGKNLIPERLICELSKDELANFLADG